MPIYEYECIECGRRFEKRQGFGEDGRPSCPFCQGEARRVFHPVPIIFKGPGFYVTDSRGSGNKEDKEEEKK